MNLIMIYINLDVGRMKEMDTKNKTNKGKKDTPGANMHIKKSRLRG